MNYSKIIIAAAAVLVALFFLRGCFTGAEGEIRKQLNELEELVSFDASEAELSSLTKSKRLSELFAEDVVIELKGFGGSKRVLRGRQSIQQASMAVRAQVSSLEVSLHDVAIQLDQSKTLSLIHI